MNSIGDDNWELLENDFPVGRVRVAEFFQERCATGCGTVLEMVPGDVVPVMHYPALHLAPDPLCSECAERHLAGFTPVYDDAHRLTWAVSRDTRWKESRG